MKKLYALLCLVGLLFANTIIAQLPQSRNIKFEKKKIDRADNLTPATEKCGFSYMMEKAKAAGFNESLYEQKMAELIQQRIANFGISRPAVIYNVPVIFHVIYSGTSEATIGTGANLYQDLVDSQIVQLNKDFANLSGSIYGVAQDMGIRFVAAKADPSGNLLCEPGIDRIDWETRAGWVDPFTLTTTSAIQTHFDGTVKPQSIWDPYRYLNVWLADFSGSTLLGYATFPGNSTLAGLDNLETDQTAGVVLLSYSVGSISNPNLATPYDMGRTATHEIGHFFGLRHIWGDGTCATDYCADTPAQDAATSGCPATGTLNNCVPSGPKMFENYMDYTDDACLNTFTNDQSLRCQTVMANSPRRISLATSNTGNSPIPNRISFLPGTIAIYETGNAGVCPRYRDITITLDVDIAATGNATVSLTKTGTASDIYDYTITPASVTYTNGDAANKTFTIRIYDDALVESEEDIILGINVVGTGVLVSPACPDVNQYTLTIFDNDFNIAVNNTTATTNLMSENFGTTAGSNQVPAGWTVSNSGTATNKWVGNSAGAATYGFTGNTLHVSNGNATAVNNGTAAMTYTVTTTTDARVTTPTFNATGLKNLNLSFSYVCNGELDAGTYYDLGVIYYSIDGGTSYYLATDVNGDPYLFQGVTSKTTLNFPLPLFATGAPSLKFLFRWINDNSIGFQPPFAIDDVVLTGESVTVEDQQSNTGTVYLNANSGSGYIYSALDGQILTRIENLSENVGCLTANINTAGTGQTSVTTNAGTYSRSNKVLQVTPSVANTTASYQITLYYTTAELAVWGANVPTLKILKVNDGVSLASTLNSSNAKIYNATVDDQRATKGYASFTATVTGGFSQFMLASPTIVIPVTLLSFDAKGNGKNILLNWSTATEINNKGFVIERSTNGTDFEKIGWMDGKGNSSQQVNYSYIDNYVQPDVVYYYRLRQTDTDNREKLSAIRSARIKGSGIIVTMSPNPASDQLKVFVSGMSGTVNINLVNAEGQLIRSWNQLNATSAPAKLDITGISSGMYLLQVFTAQSTTVEKLIIR